MQCDMGRVFGGYADASWTSAPGRTYVSSPGAFLFSVTDSNFRGRGREVVGPVFLPVVAGKEYQALVVSVHYGPCFLDGLYLRGDPFGDEWSYCASGNNAGVTLMYKDDRGRTMTDVTGLWRFGPVEVEVYGVTVKRA